MATDLSCWGGSTTNFLAVTLGADLQAAGATDETHSDPETGHGFHNNSMPRYNEAAAQLARERTIAWFTKYLS